MELEKARKVIQRLVDVMEPACERIEVAGSIRRGKPDVHDGELVYIPRMVVERVDFFQDGLMPATDLIVHHLVEVGVLKWDDVVKRNGPKYKRLIDTENELVVELFRATAENWGLQLALRTGPSGFNKVLVAKPWAGGVMPIDMIMRDAFLWRCGQKLVTLTEEDFFRELGVPYWPPEERNPVKLARLYRDNRVRFRESVRRV